MGRNTKFKLKKIVPQIARKYNTISPSEIRNKILVEHNKAVTVQAISNVFYRNPQLKESIAKEIHDEEKAELEVRDTIFVNGTFEELESVKRWIEIQNTNEVSPKFMRNRISCLKLICSGKIPSKKPLSQREQITVPKHPDRLTIADCQTYIAKIREHKKNTHRYRLTARSFMESKGIKVLRSQISGDKGNVGKFSKLYISPEKVDAIFDLLKYINYNAYLATAFMFANGTRVGSTLNASISDVWEDEGTIMVTVIDKGRHSKGRKRWDKIIPNTLWEEIKETNPQEKLFPISNKELIEALRETYKTIIPKLAPQITMPCHFWRHQFAQHMLRKCDWNYDIVAQLGGWIDTNTLKQCYGMPPKAVIQKWGKEYQLFNGDVLKHKVN